MAGRYLIDTNVVIELLANRAWAISRIKLQDAMFLSVIAYGELLFGIANSVHREANRSRLDRLLVDWQLVPCMVETGEFYASIRSQLKRDGRPIPEHDIWIAATAMQHDLTLVTRDDHFDHIENLRVERWA
jgi:tRNA(fMet)-specific endonuclease VapC